MGWIFRKVGMCVLGVVGVVLVWVWVLLVGKVKLIISELVVVLVEVSRKWWCEMLIGLLFGSILFRGRLCGWFMFVFCWFWFFGFCFIGWW